MDAWRINVRRDYNSSTTGSFDRRKRHTRAERQPDDDDSCARSPRPAQTHSRAGFVAHLPLSRARNTRRRHAFRNDDRPGCAAPPLAPRRRVAPRRRPDLAIFAEPRDGLAARASPRLSPNLPSDRTPPLSSRSGQGHREPRRRGPENRLRQGYAPRTTTPPLAISRRLNGFVPSPRRIRRALNALRPAPRSRTSQDRRGQTEGQDEDAHPRRGDQPTHLRREFRLVRPVHLPTRASPLPPSSDATPARRCYFSARARRRAAASLRIHRSYPSIVSI